MAANNCIMLIGRLGRDPDLRFGNSGTAITTFSLAVDRPRKDQNGNRVTDWFNVKLFGRQAEMANEMLRKGSTVAIAGACHIEKWTDRDGNAKERTVIAADAFQILDRRQEGDQAPTAANRTQTAPPPGERNPGSYFDDDDDIPPF